MTETRQNEVWMERQRAVCRHSSSSNCHGLQAYTANKIDVSEYFEFNSTTATQRYLRGSGRASRLIAGALASCDVTLVWKVGDRARGL